MTIHYTMLENIRFGKLLLNYSMTSEQDRKKLCLNFNIRPSLQQKLETMNALQGRKELSSSVNLRCLMPELAAESSLFA